jgi:molecular chaperone DnaK (HSP70)
VRLGIDFGTTRTVVAYADRGNYPVVSFVDDGGDSVDWVPSVVAERAGELRFGLDAAAVAGDPSFTFARSFKRWLSAPDAGPARPVTVGGTTLALGDLVTRFLAHVRDAIRTRSNASRAASRAAELVAAVGIPANAHGAQRLVTLDAFRRAGFSVSAMIHEPSAAGFEYTHRHRDTLSSRRDLVVVYDLGGGTFDASLVRMTGRFHEVLATAGVSRLGGDDFDAVLAALTLAQAGMNGGPLDAAAEARLLVQCRDVKERLHPSSRKVTVDLADALGGGAPRGEITFPVDAYYEACAPLVERSIAELGPLMSRLETEGAATELAQIAGVYVVGGASALPVVARMLRERFGRRVHRSPHPSAAIAIGLAIACDEGAGFELADRTSHVFCVFREGGAGQEVTLDPIFAKGSALPARAAGPRTFTREYRAAHNVGHFRFFECSALDEGGTPRGDLTPFGEVLFPFDASLEGAGDLAGEAVERRATPGPRIAEEYTLDENGIVGVVIRNVDSGHQRAYRLGS